MLIHRRGRLDHPPSHKHPPAPAQPGASFCDKGNYNIPGEGGVVPRLSPQRSFCYNRRQFNRGLSGGLLVKEPFHGVAI